MKLIIEIYLALYMVIVAACAGYGFFKTKKMNAIQLLFVALALVLIGFSLFSYHQAYQPIEMVGFALAFTVISSTFLYNHRDGQTSFFLVMGLSVMRLFIHLQLLFFLYLFR